MNTYILYLLDDQLGVAAESPLANKLAFWIRGGRAAHPTVVPRLGRSCDDDPSVIRTCSSCLITSRVHAILSFFLYMKKIQYDCLHWEAGRGNISPYMAIKLIIILARHMAVKYCAYSLINALN